MMFSSTRHALEDLRRLERAHHSGAVAVLHRSARSSGWPRNAMRAGLQRQVAADDVEQRGLARAVRADQADQAALAEPTSVTLRSTVKPPNRCPTPSSAQDVARSCAAPAPAELACRLPQQAHRAHPAAAPRRRPAPARTGSDGCRRSGSATPGRMVTNNAPSTTPHSERTPPSTGISRKPIDLSTVKLCTLVNET